MGCWNATCMVTNLPILVGDPVVCQVIAAAPFADPLKSAGDTCYAHDRFQPVGWPLRAKYNDYGYIQDIEEGIYADDTLAYIRRHLIERPQGENEYHDHAVRKVALSWEALDDWFHGKRVLFTNPGAGAYPEYPKQRSVGMVMIHQSVYEAMALYQGNWGWRDIQPEIQRLLAGPKGDGLIGELDRISAKGKLGQFIQGREMNSPVDLQGADANETARRLAEMVYFESSMGTARRQWMPMSGAGSQSEEWNLFRQIARVGEAIAQRREAELREDDEDNDTA